MNGFHFSLCSALLLHSVRSVWVRYFFFFSFFFFLFCYFLNKGSKWKIYTYANTKANFLLNEIGIVVKAVFATRQTLCWQNSSRRTFERCWRNFWDAENCTSKHTSQKPRQHKQHFNQAKPFAMKTLSFWQKRRPTSDDNLIPRKWNYKSETILCNLQHSTVTLSSQVISYRVCVCWGQR